MKESPSSWQKLITIGGFFLGIAGTIFGSVEAAGNSIHSVLEAKIAAVDSKVVDLKADMQRQFDRMMGLISAKGR